MEAVFKAGFAIWGYKGWIGDFFPVGSPSSELLRLYGERVEAVEGNTTFYAVPSAEVVASWASKVPEGFRFCPKLPQAVSHDGALAPKVDEALSFLERMQGLGERLGPLIAQLPPSYGPEMIEDLGLFLERWPRGEAPLAVEVRHLGWFEAPGAEALEGLLGDLGVGRAILDARPIYHNAPSAELLESCRKPDVPLTTSAPSTFSVVRYISHPEPSLNDAFLRVWARRVGAWLDAGISVYFFVHCPQEERSPAVLRRLFEILEDAGVGVSPPPWFAIKPPPKQLALF